MLSTQVLDGPKYVLRREHKHTKEAWLCDSDSATSIDLGDEPLQKPDVEESYFKRMQRLLVEAARKEHIYESRKADSKMRLFSTDMRATHFAEVKEK